MTSQVESRRRKLRTRIFNCSFLFFDIFFSFWICFDLFCLSDWNAHLELMVWRHFRVGVNPPCCHFAHLSKRYLLHLRVTLPDARRSTQLLPRCCGSGRAWRGSGWTWSGSCRAGYDVHVERDAGPCCCAWRCAGSRGMRRGYPGDVAGCGPAGLFRSRRFVRRRDIVV